MTRKYVCASDYNYLLIFPRGAFKCSSEAHKRRNPCPCVVVVYGAGVSQVRIRHVLRNYVGCDNYEDAGHLSLCNEFSFICMESATSSFFRGRRRKQFVQQTGKTGALCLSFKLIPGAGPLPCHFFPPFFPSHCRVCNSCLIASYN